MAPFSLVFIKKKSIHVLFSLSFTLDAFNQLGQSMFKKVGEEYYHILLCSLLWYLNACSFCR